MDNLERFISGCKNAIRSAGESTHNFGVNWSEFKSSLEGDPHVPDLESTYIEPMLRTQSDLLEAVDDLRQAANKFSQVSEEADLSARGYPKHP